VGADDRGTLQIQSEAAEVFYRNIEIRPIPPCPTHTRSTSNNGDIPRLLVNGDGFEAVRAAAYVPA
jgi:hypothetical protein